MLYYIIHIFLQMRCATQLSSTIYKLLLPLSTFFQKLFLFLKIFKPLFFACGEVNLSLSINHEVSWNQLMETHGKVGWRASLRNCGVVFTCVGVTGSNGSQNEYANHSSSQNPTYTSGGKRSIFFRYILINRNGARDKTPHLTRWSWRWNLIIHSGDLA